MINAARDGHTLFIPRTRTARYVATVGKPHHRGDSPRRVTPCGPQLAGFARHLSVAGWCLLIGSLFGGGPGWADEPMQASPVVTREEIDTAKTAAAEDATLSDEQKLEAANLVRQALDDWQAAQAAGQKGKLWRSKVAEAAREAAEREAALSALPERPLRITVPVDSTLEQIEQTVAVWEQRVSDPDTGLKKRLADAEALLANRRDRLSELPAELQAAEQRVEDLRKSPAPMPLPGEPAVITTLRRIVARAQRMRAAQQLAALQTESLWTQDATAETVVTVERDLLKRRLALADAEYKQWQELLKQRREADAAERAAAAAMEVLRAHPSLKPLAEANRLLADQARTATEEIAEWQDATEAARERYEQLEREATRLKEMVDAVGLTESIGLLLRRQRGELRTLVRELDRTAERSETMRSVRLKLFELDRPTTLPVVTDAPNDPALQTEAERLTERREELQTELRDVYQRAFAVLVELDHAEQQLAQQARSFGRFIDERALWVRTGTPLNWEHLAAIGPALTQAARATEWSPLVARLQTDVRQRPAVYGLAMIGLLCWAWLRRRWRAQLTAAGAAALACGGRSFQPTMHAVLATLGLSAGLPLLGVFLAWRLGHHAAGSAWGQLVSHGLWHAALFLAPLQLVRWICAKHGLADDHYDWPDDTLRRVQRHLGWFTPLSVVLIGAIAVVEAGSDELQRDVLGRGMLLAFSAAVGLFCFAVLNVPAGQPGWNATELNRIRHWVRWARWGGMGMAAGLIVLDWLGYFQTAWEFGGRLQQTVWLGIGLITVRSTVLRWITVEEHRMHDLQQEQPPPDHAVAPRSPALPAMNPFLFPRFNWPDWSFDLTRVVEQMHGLLQAGLVTSALIGLWVIWSETVPALQLFDQWVLWQTTVELAGEQTVRAISVANVGLAVLLVIASTVAARNIPGLIEVVLLERLPVDAGARFAVTSLVRYALFVCGSIAAFEQIGIGWSKVQWLIAAASVGLGFGLQEIFANFVSGVILLFERPIRVGDVITIGETTGTVSKIRFRATTITDWDRKELVVPNKEFITGKLLNWTLSDQINRVVVHVGVAYGTDPHRVRTLLIEAAQQHPAVLQEPAPSALFDGFGESALTFTLRCFLPSLQERSRVIHDLHTTIYERLQAEGIEIPFPQRDLHLRTPPVNGQTTETLAAALQQAGLAPRSASPVGQAPA